MDKRLTAICGDAIQEMKKIPANNLIVTDPPYDLNKDYINNQDSLAFGRYISFQGGLRKKGCLQTMGQFMFMGVDVYIIYELSKELGMAYFMVLGIILKNWKNKVIRQGTIFCFHEARKFTCLDEIKSSECNVL